MKPPHGTPSLEEFLSGPRRNLWLSSRCMHVYIRRGAHMLEKQITQCLDIANIEVDEDFKGQGLFTSWLTYAEHTAKARGLQAVFIENIMTERFHLFFFHRGYREQESDRSSMYKFV